MILAPPLCRQLFARSIILAGLGLAEVAAVWTLFLALAAVRIVGASAGIAFLTGQTSESSQLCGSW
jgi:dTMP kinase